MFVIVYFCPQAGKDLYETIGGTQEICNLSPAILLSRPSAHTTVLMHWDINPRSCVVAQSSQSLERRRVPPFWTHAPLSEALPGQG